VSTLHGRGGGRETGMLGSTSSSELAPDPAPPRPPRESHWKLESSDCCARPAPPRVAPPRPLPPDPPRGATPGSRLPRAPPRPAS
jgi:hypothetical protein